MTYKFYFIYTSSVKQKFP